MWVSMSQRWVTLGGNTCRRRELEGGQVVLKRVGHGSTGGPATGTF